MGNRTAKFISAVIGSIIVGAPLSAVSQNAPGGAADCLAAPKGATPQGQHWFYRLDRSSKRKCWYLREVDAKAAPGAQAATAAPETVAPAPQSVQDAHAEFTPPQQQAAPARPTTSAVAPTAPAAALVPQPQAAASDTSNQPAAETIWPDPSTVAAAPVPQPAPASGPKLADARRAPKSPAMAPAGTMTLASADAIVDKPSGSLQMLVLVIGAALALAGILASVVYHLARSRVRVGTSESGRRVNWDRFEPADDSRAPWLAQTGASGAAHPQPSRPIDFDLARPAVAKIDVADERTAVARVAHDEPIEPDMHVSEDTQISLPEEAEIALAAEAIEVPLARADAHAEDAEDPAADAVDIDAITAILERLAKEGPRLAERDASSSELATGSREESASSQGSRVPRRSHRSETGSSPEADLADFVQSRLSRSAARA
jgi:hypothetical protein